MEQQKSLQKLGLIASLIIFGCAATIFYLETHYLIPWLSEMTGWETVISWFLVGGLGAFIPFLILALILIKNENLSINRQTWTERLRFKKLNITDWFWSIGGIIIIGMSIQLIIRIIEITLGKADMHPSFMAFEPLSYGRYWILAAWLPFWLFNIMGEEILWRGVLLPRQELAFGKWTWIYHGTFWMIFHIAFGWQLIITLLPILFIQSYIVQKRKNNWIGVIIHAGLNGPGFIAVAFGLV